MAQTVVGFFDNPSDAQRAVQELQRIGLTRESIDISSGNQSTGTSSSSTSTVSDSRDRDGDHREGNAITRFFNSLFGDDDDEATRYSRVAQNSNSIVTVHARSDEEAERAADILDEYGAVDVDERSAQYGYDRTSNSGYSNTDRDRTISSDRDSDTDTTINRVEENLEVGKREVERGGVRVRSRIVERPVEENVRLREEHVHVERNPVDRPISGNDMENFQERDIELTERAEVPVVNKEARVVEEIRVSKDVEERNETVRDTVRKTDVDVEDIDRGRTTNVSNNLSNSDDVDDLDDVDDDYDDDDDNDLDTDVNRRDRSL
jgi:stress response protein YsnF